MFKKSIFFILIATLALTACAPALRDSQTANEGESYAVGGGGAASVAATAAPAAPQEAADAANSGAGQRALVERLVIKNANLSLVVKEPVASVNSITTLAESVGGFVVNSNVYQTSTDAAGNKIMQADIAIRVPADKLQTVLDQIKGMAVTVNSENISGQDVTAEYTDLESRLRNLESAEAQLQKIMDGATKTEDVLAVYNQLVYIREQIEQVKGQMQYYREAAAMSLISISLIPDALSQPIEVGGWKPQGVAKDAIEALVRAFQGIASALIWIVIYLLPLALLFGIPIYAGLRFISRRLRRPKSSATA
jgi:hypothetical protein